MTAIQANNTTSGRAVVETPSAALKLLANSQLGGVVDLGALAQGVVDLAQRDLTGALDVLRDLTEVLPVLDLERLVADTGGLLTAIGGLVQDGIGQPVGRLVEGLTEGVRDGLDGAADGLARTTASLSPDVSRRIDGTILGPVAALEQGREAGAAQPLRLGGVGGLETGDRVFGLTSPLVGWPTATMGLVKEAPGLAVGSATETERSAVIGQNAATWTMDSLGRPIRAEATLREVFTDVERSSAETRAQAAAADRGVEGDHGGHIIGHRFVKDQGPDNLFPQNGDFNLSAYKTLENEMADWVDAGAEVRVTVDLLGGGDRPVRVRVAYEVMSAASGALVYDNTVLFRNAADQTFDRTPSSDMKTLLNG